MPDFIKDLVTQIQKELLVQGVNPGPIDGIMGGQTFEALKLYQTRGARPTSPPKVKKFFDPVKDSAPSAPLVMQWRLAQSLFVLRTQINAAFPNRDKASDGTIGDAKHTSRTSDHNPWIDGPDGIKVVSALDITHDPDNGCDCSILSRALVHDKRVKYIIFDGMIYNPTISLKWRKYTGGNPHTKHMHVSVSNEVELYDNTNEWDITP
jgi:hypothetical protein